MSVCSWIAIALWVIFGIIALTSPDSVKFTGQRIKNPFLRLLAGLAIGPAVGMILMLAGHLIAFIGALLSAPIFEWINPAWIPF